MIMKKIFRFLIPLAFLLAVSLFSVEAFPLSGTGVVFFDIGQGDAVILEVASGQTILIDGGPDDQILRCLGEELPFWRRRIDLVIVSHPHDDHLLGLIAVAKRYHLGGVIYGAGEEDEGLMPEFLQVLSSQGIPAWPLSGAESHSYDACRLDIFNPESLAVPTDENNSLVVKLLCPDFSVLFTGDSSVAVEEALLASGRDWSADIFKAAHHGSKTANSEAFLRAVSPKIMIFSVGAANRFGHPHPEVIERARSLGIDLWRTDESGTIRLKKESQ